MCRSWCLVIVLFASVSVPVSSLPPDFVTETILNGGLKGEPMGLSFTSDGFMVVAERLGLIWIADPLVKPLKKNTFMQITNLNANGEKGLLDAIIHPDFNPSTGANNFIFVYYCRSSPARCRASKFSFSGTGASRVASLSSEVLLWEDTDGYYGPWH